jgi:hypothetical protein
MIMTLCTMLLTVVTMCDCASKYMINAKIYLGKENNEVARWLASDVICTLVQPISGQDRGGRNVTDNFFTSVDLANQLKNKIWHLLGHWSKTKEKFHKSSSLPGNVMKTRLFLDLPRIAHLCHMSQRRTNQLSSSSSLHHDSAICRDSGKPEIIEFYNKTKGAVDMLDQMCARYTLQRATHR